MGLNVGIKLNAAILSKSGANFFSPDPFPSFREPPGRTSDV